MKGIADAVATDCDCIRVSPPKGINWRSFAIRLLKHGALTMDHDRKGRRITRLAIKAVHGKLFDRYRAKLLLEMTEAFLEE